MEADRQGRDRRIQLSFLLPGCVALLTDQTLGYKIKQSDCTQHTFGQFDTPRISPMTSLLDRTSSLWLLTIANFSDSSLFVLPSFSASHGPIIDTCFHCSANVTCVSDQITRTTFRDGVAPVWPHSYSRKWICPGFPCKTCKILWNNNKRPWQQCFPALLCTFSAWALVNAQLNSR